MEDSCYRLYSHSSFEWVVGRLVCGRACNWPYGLPALGLEEGAAVREPSNIFMVLMLTTIIDSLAVPFVVRTDTSSLLFLTRDAIGYVAY